MLKTPEASSSGLARSALSSLPRRAGIGFKPQHFEELSERGSRTGFLEVHAENYMGAGGPALAQLERLRRDYPLSLHGVALSIGGEGPLNLEHLTRLRILLERFQPSAFSEHLAWSSHGPYYFNDLLPVAYDGPTLDRVCEHVDLAQNTLGRRLLLENPSTYLQFSESSIDEVAFISEVARRTGCGLLLDVNNVAVSCANHGRDPFAYLDAFPVACVGEIHLAGYAEEHDTLGAPLRIDAHGSPVEPDVWALFRHILNRTGPIATLIEWDNDVPDLATLLAEAKKADACLAGSGNGCRAA
ncbi:MAG TPA: DUF692 domain-containing protein [Beijerinckiaceae bacterium]|nr:DUF692 domain-containing protein [Beijerinckiaceae bacterium]